MEARIDAHAVALPRAPSDALRSALIFLPDDGRVTQVGDALVMLTPSNPGYWWGNSLRFADPPRAGDFERWTALFAEHVHRVQPASRHWTFGWDSEATGHIAPFVDAGFVHFETMILGADRGATIRAPHPVAVRIEPVRDDRWRGLADLLIETREPVHTAADYAAFAEQRIAGWRALDERGQGCFFGIEEGGRLVAALGVFAEARRGADGRRIGRYQHVVTDPSFRRRGFAGTLVAHAAAYAFERLDVDTLLIAADANDVARHLYEAAGFRIRTRHCGLERGS